MHTLIDSELHWVVAETNSVKNLYSFLGRDKVDKWQELRKHQ